LLSAGIYLYLQNRFNGALLLLFMASLPFMAGMCPFISRGRRPGLYACHRLCAAPPEPTWSWGTILLLLLLAAVFTSPFILRQEGDFTLEYDESAGPGILQVTRAGQTTRLKDIEENLAYHQKHHLILGHTLYQLEASRDRITLSPLSPEKLEISPGIKAIICDLNRVTPGTIIYT